MLTAMVVLLYNLQKKFLVFAPIITEDVMHWLLVLITLVEETAVNVPQDIWVVVIVVVLQSVIHCVKTMPLVLAPMPVTVATLLSMESSVNSILWITPKTILPVESLKVLLELLLCSV